MKPTQTSAHAIVPTPPSAPPPPLTSQAALASDNPQDAELIALMTQGDRAALAELYARHVQGLLAIAHNILREQQEAEDVIHDVFLEVWRHCGDYSRARGSVRAWLGTRTRSRALDRWRSGSRHRTATNQVAGAPDASADQLHDHSGASDQHRLPAALAQIPDPLQRVIQLAYFEGLSTVEISSRLGIPTGTVKSRTHTAIRTLRSLLGVKDA